MAPREHGKVDVRPVADDEWDVVAWLWQLFRHDLAAIVGGLPNPDGRYLHAQLDPLPGPDAAGYLAWVPHPSTGQDAPVGFAVVRGLTAERRSILGFWTSPVLRRTGLGTELALDVVRRHDAPWSIAFQQANTGAGHFWHRLADLAFGPDGWTQEARPVPGKPDLLPDQWILSR